MPEDRSWAPPQTLSDGVFHPPAGWKPGDDITNLPNGDPKKPWSITELLVGARHMRDRGELVIKENGFSSNAGEIMLNMMGAPGMGVVEKNINIPLLNRLRRLLPQKAQEAMVTNMELQAEKEMDRLGVSIKDLMGGHVEEDALAQEIESLKHKAFRAPTNRVRTADEIHAEWKAEYEARRVERAANTKDALHFADTEKVTLGKETLGYRPTSDAFNTSHFSRFDKETGNYRNGISMHQYNQSNHIIVSNFIEEEVPKVTRDELEKLLKVYHKARGLPAGEYDVTGFVGRESLNLPWGTTHKVTLP